MHSKTNFDRSKEDVGNVQLLEHVNVTVPDQGLAAMFYVTGLGFTRDPYIDFGTFNMWVKLGDQQFHLPVSKPQVVRGHVGVVVPELEGLLKRLGFAEKALSETSFQFKEEGDHVELTCPYGNTIKAYEPDKFSNMDLGMPYVEFKTPPGSSKGIGKFYSSVIGCPTSIESDLVKVAMGHNQELIYRETDQPLPEYDGHHIAIYVSNFSGPHQWLAERDLISQESDQFQYRFQKIVDPDSGDLLYEIEHEVRSLSHQMYRRPLVNRNPATNFFTYRRGNEQFSPAT